MLSHAVTRSRESAIRAGLLPESDRCTWEEVEASRLVSSPLRLLHCSKVADGAAAVIARPARGGAGEVRPLGAGEHHRSGYFVHGAESGAVGAGAAAELAFSQAGLTAADIRQAYVYDAFASSIGQTIEELGFADPGTAYGELRDGAFAWDGRVTINPHGGLLSLGNPGYPSGLYHVAAAVADLRAGRMAGDADVALVHGSGGVMSSQAVALLERPR
jgi:acetyl-CoA acetyltransferase